MRVQYHVTAQAKGWSLGRGQTHISHHEDRQGALQAAENFARATAAKGHPAVVKVFAGGEIQEQRSFEPDIF